MKSFILAFVIAVFLLGRSYAAGPATVTVEDTVYAPSGQPFSGQVTISNPAFISPDGYSVPSNTQVLTIQNGVIDLTLVPTINTIPVTSVNYYTVTFTTNPTMTQYWMPYTTASPVDIAQIQVYPPLPPLPSTPPAINIAQGGTGATTVAAALTNLGLNSGVEDLVVQSLTAKSVNGILNAATGALSSIQSTTGSISSGSTSLTVANAIDFQNNNGIVVIGAGATNTLSAPGTPTITAVGSPTSSQTCEYAVAALDSNMGETAAGTATAATDCGGVGNSTNNVITTYNTLSWTPVTNAQGYVVYEKIGSGAWQVAQVVTIPADIQWWTSSTAYQSGAYIQPRGAQYNGWTYKVTTAGTSGSSQPTWCTTSGCTVTDGTITWTAQQSTFNDDGRNWAWFGIRPNSPWIPATPPASAINDALVTTISSGAGSTTLTLATAASNTSPSGAYVGHDSTAAIQSQVNASNTGCISIQPAAGLAYYGTCNSVQVPSGNYYISSPITVSSLYESIYGTNDTVINNINPVVSSIVYSNLYQNTLKNLTLVGGKNQITGYNCGTDNTQIQFKGLRLELSNDYAISLFNNCLTGDLHLSSSVNVNDTKFIGDEGELYYYGDRFVWHHNWSELEAPTNSLMAGRAEIVLPESGGEFHSSDSEYIPGFGTPSGGSGGYPPYMRWNDDYWNYYSTADRFSGEGGGGMPCTYYFGGFPVLNSGDGIYNSGTVSYVNDWLFCGGMNAGVSTNSGSGKLWLANGIPQTTIFKNDYGFSEPLISVSPSNNIDVGLLPTMKSGINPSPQYSSIGAINIELSPNNAMEGCNAVWNSLVLQSPAEGQVFPASLVPYVTDPECRQLNATPTDGFWGVNEKVFQINYSGSVGNRGWTNLRQGQAAPAWAASTAYTVGQFVVASPDNQHVFECTTAGTSGSSQPTWTTTSGGTTTDGTVTWTEEGQSALFAPLAPPMLSDGSMSSPFNAALTIEGSSSSVPEGLCIKSYTGQSCSALYAPGASNQFWSGTAPNDLGIVAANNLWLGSNGNGANGIEISTSGNAQFNAGATIPSGETLTNSGTITGTGTANLSGMTVPGFSVGNNDANYLTLAGAASVLAGAASGSTPTITCGGSDTNVNCNLAGQGGGSINLGTNGKNYISIIGTTSGWAPVFESTGSDTSVGMRIETKGNALITLYDSLTTNIPSGDAFVTINAPGQYHGNIGANGNDDFCLATGGVGPGLGTCQLHWSSTGVSIAGTLSVTGSTTASTLTTASNCSSSASPAVCGSAAAGSVVVAAGATTVVVDTTAVTANSQIFAVPDSSLGTKLSVTCNTTLLTSDPQVTARTAGTSFTLTLGVAPVTNPDCFSYLIVN